MLFTPPPAPENPHAPFVYRDGEIRHVDEYGDRYEADVIETRGHGWRWTTSYVPDETEDDAGDRDSGRGNEYGDEEHAVRDAVAWLRAKWDEVRGIE